MHFAKSFLGNWKVPIVVGNYYSSIFSSFYFHQAKRLGNLKNRRSLLAESCGGNSK